jgi:hypothetical protein
MKNAIRTLVASLLALAFIGCGSAFIPTIEHPSPSQWCFDWVFYGYPAKACFGSAAEMHAAKAKMVAAARHGIIGHAVSKSCCSFPDSSRVLSMRRPRPRHALSGN